MKYKVLVWCDTPCCNTGFGTVSRNILSNLYKTGRFDFEIVGINHEDTYYDREKFPYKIHAPNMYRYVTSDPYGLAILESLVQTNKYDLFFAINDFGVINTINKILKALQEKGTKVITYIPVDLDVLPSQITITSFLEYVDKCVLYHEDAQDVVSDHTKSDKYTFIHHGVDTKSFYEVSRSEAKNFKVDTLKIHPDAFLVTNVNRNQWRKDLARTIFAFGEFLKKTTKKDSTLYLHSKLADIGGNLLMQSTCLNVPIQNIRFLPTSVTENKGMPIEYLNKAYNASDVVVSTSLGEGFGLSCIESMATRTPVLMPNNTAFKVQCGEGRGMLADCGTTTSEWVVPYGNNTDFPRPLTNVDDFVKKLLAISEGEYKEEMVEKAFNWAVEHDWSKIGEQWIKLFFKTLKQ